MHYTRIKFQGIIKIQFTVILESDYMGPTPTSVILRARIQS